MEELIAFRVQQTLFENDYTQFSKKLKAVKAAKAAYIVLAVFMLLLAGVMAYWEEYAQVVIFIVFAAVIVALAYSYPSILGKNLYKNTIKLQNANPIFNEIVFCENHIFDNSKNSSITFEYSQIEKIIETQNHFLLMITNSSGLIVKKDSFIQGDISQFRGFIASKSHIF